MSDEYMRWKASQARCWAVSVRGAVKALDASRQALDAIIKQADGLKAVRYDGNGSGATKVSGDDAIVEAIARVEDMADAVRRQADECSDQVTTFQSCLSCIDFNHRAVLQLHYVRCFTWDKVADVVGYAPEYVRNELSMYALAALYDVMPRQYRTMMPRADE